MPNQEGFPQLELFDSRHPVAQRFAAGEVEVSPHEKPSFDAAAAEQQLDRLDGQGQTSPVMAEARVGIEMDDGTPVPVLPRLPKPPRPAGPNRWDIPSHRRTVREQRAADQPPEHVRHNR